MRKLFVISDLHLGGRSQPCESNLPPFQFNNSYPALIEFIDWIRGESKAAGTAGGVELVINGDIVDFLAEDDFGEEPGARVWTSNEHEAVAKLDGIASRTRDAAGRGVFEALREFVASGNRLTLLLGNHDIELALPDVRKRLLALLGGPSASIDFIYDGEAYVAGRVLIEHGNRYDRWNMIDHSALRQERSMLSRKLPIDESRRSEDYFVPPAGTHLVVEVINRIKSRYRFIDLVKPETNAVIPLLLALEPGLGPHVAAILKNGVILRQLRKNKLRGPATPYNKEALAADFGDLPPLREVLSDTLGADAGLFGQQLAGRSDTDLSLKEAQDWLATRWHQMAEQLSSVSSLLKINFSRFPEDRRRQLHAALRALNERDESYLIEHEDPVYLDAATETARRGNFDAIIYGHTHLPKKLAIATGAGSAWYVNTGTWCDVIRLPPGLSASYAEAENALTAFMDALRENDFDPYVRRYLSYAELAIDSTQDGRLDDVKLYSFCGPGRERSAPLTSWPAVA